MPEDENKWWQQLPRLVREGLWTLSIFLVSSTAVTFFLVDGKAIPYAGTFAFTFFIIAAIAIVRLVVTALHKPALDAAGIKGSSSFIDAEHDAEMLSGFGRKGDISNLRENALDDQIRLLVFVGKPGCGKTSILRAGLK